jgi:glycosyltransferase involved in cell wall biosynthesis
MTRNILILNYEYPPLGGGAGVCTRYEAEGLASLGHNVTVLTTWFPGEKVDEKNGSLRIIRLKSRRKHTFKSNPIEMLSWVRCSKDYLSKNVNKEGFDICLANFAIPGGIVGKWLKKKHGVPYVIISHGQDIPFFFPKQMLKYHLLTYYWIKNIVMHSEKLVLLTRDMKKNADKFLGKKGTLKNVIIPNGCYTDYFQPDATKKLEAFRILFVGRLVAQKDPITFLRALNIIRDQGVVFDVHINGDGPMRKEMEAFVSKNKLSSLVTFNGWVSKEEMLHAYQSAQLQVISSADEAMSIAALESLSCGLYVISTPVSGNNELIRPGINGDFMNFGDPKSLAAKIIEYYNNRFKLGIPLDDQLLEDFRSKYDWKNVVRSYQELIEDILN